MIVEGIPFNNDIEKNNNLLPLNNKEDLKENKDINSISINETKENILFLNKNLLKLTNQLGKLISKLDIQNQNIKLLSQQWSQSFEIIQQQFNDMAKTMNSLFIINKEKKISSKKTINFFIY